MIFQQKGQHWQNVIKYARMDAREWKEAEKLQEDLQNQQTTTLFRREHRWKKPTEGWMKCNVDGSFINENVISNAGWVVINDTGLFKGAVQAKGKMVHTPLESELQAILMALQFCWARGYRRIITEGDNQKAIQLFNY